VHVIATAGHVDHGKSTLVRALTGMEPDRWAEERRRGMTIDLGFAWTRLPSGRQVAFVDVPGHERFATNMLAGVGPVPAVMLVIAADDGWAAQTEDHVRALHALGVSHGVVAVTRTDLAEPGRAVAEATQRLAATSLAGIPAVAVSGATGAGLADLRAALDQLAAGLAEPDPRARVRFWLDRCFTIRGSGTVVTGTLGAGTIRLGDTLELRGRSVTVRGLQCLGAAAAQASGTARVALNLRGVARDDVHRGDVLLSPAAWRRSSVLDVRATAGVDLPTRLVVHVGSAAVPATVRALGPPGADAQRAPAVRLRLAAALPLQVGDRLLLRDPGRRLVVGGAIVLDPAPPPLRGRGAAQLRAADLLDHPGTPDLAGELSRRGAVPVTLLAEIGVAVPEPLPSSAVAAGRWLVAAGLWSRWLDGLAAAVDGGAGAGLTDAGVAAADVARALSLPDLSLLAPLLAAARRFEDSGGRVRRRGTPVVLRADVVAAVAQLAVTLRRRPFQAPEQPQLEALGLGARELGAAAAAGAILRLPGDVVLLTDAPGIAVGRLRDLPQPFTMSSARQALDTTRRVAVPLLEYLDTTRATERVDGTLRRVRVPGTAAPARTAPG
jgi:selenocysteine-specific elongation factor